VPRCDSQNWLVVAQILSCLELPSTRPMLLSQHASAGRGSTASGRGARSAETGSEWCRARFTLLGESTAEVALGSPRQLLRSHQGLAFAVQPWPRVQCFRAVQLRSSRPQRSKPCGARCSICLRPNAPSPAAWLWLPRPPASDGPATPADRATPLGKSRPDRLAEFLPSRRKVVEPDAGTWELRAMNSCRVRSSRPTDGTNLGVRSGSAGQGSVVVGCVNGKNAGEDGGYWPRPVQLRQGRHSQRHRRGDRTTKRSGPDSPLPRAMEIRVACGRRQLPRLNGGDKTDHEWRYIQIQQASSVLKADEGQGRVAWRGSGSSQGVKQDRTLQFIRRGVLDEKKEIRRSNALAAAIGGGR